MEDKNKNENEIKRSLNETFAETQISIGTPWRLFVFSVLLFLFSLLVFFGLRVGYKNYLTSQSEKIDQDMQALSNSVSEEDQQKFINIYSQIVNLKSVLNSHIFSFNIFPFLEKNTMSRIYYRSAKFSAATRTLTLDGEAGDLQVLSAQLSQFEKSKELESATLTDMKFNPTGKTSFTISLVFKRDYLIKPI